TGYYYTRIFENYTEQRAGGRFTLGRQLDRNWGLSLTMRAEGVRVYSPQLPAPPDLLSTVGSHFLWGPRVALTHTTVDSQLAPSKGHTLEAGYEHTFADYLFPRAPR